MLKTKNFGRKSLNEIKALLSQYELTLGMDHEGWSPPNERGDEAAAVEVPTPTEEQNS